MLADLFNILLDGATDGVVHTEIFNLWIWSAQRTSGILGTSNLAKLHVEGVVDQQFVRDGFAGAENFFNGLGGLQNPHGAGQDSQDTGLLAIRNQPGRRRFWIEAAVARVAGMRLDRRQL